MLIPSPQAILFDLDGTLVDTAPDLAAATNALRAHHCLAALCVILVVSQSDFALGVGKLWWSSFIIGLLGFFYVLQGSELVFDTDDDTYF